MGPNFALFSPSGFEYRFKGAAWMQIGSRFMRNGRWYRIPDEPELTAPGLYRNLADALKSVLAPKDYPNYHSIFDRLLASKMLPKASHNTASMH